jgi:carboxypeptidase family protein
LGLGYLLTFDQENMRLNLMRRQRRGHQLLKLAGSVTLLLTVCVLEVFGQSNKATIVGTVTDTSGAVVAAATVTVTNVGTNQDRSATSNEDGTYNIPLLDIGIYRVKATAPGFKEAVRENIKLQIGDRLPVDLTMTPEGATEVVTVTAEAPSIQTESSDRGDVITGREVTELPLSGRNFTQLATLTPGVVRATNIGIAGDPRSFNNGDPRAGTGGPGSGNENGQTETSRFARSGGASLSVNGQRPTNNNFSLDGVDNNEPQFGTIGVFPNPDAIAEFRVTTSIPPAEVGRAGGAVINTTTKSGTNDIHGSLYYYGQNSALNATHVRLKTDAAEARANGVTNLDPFKKAVQQIHEFGGTVGGPIVKDKTFFFFDYLGQRNNLPFPADTVVPTLASRTGNFSGFPTIFDPVTGQAFPGNRIPANRIDPVGSAYINAYPVPTTAEAFPGKFSPGNGPNFFTQRSNREEIDNFGIKIDHRLTANNAMTGRYNDQKLNTVRANLLPGNIPTAGFGAGEERGDSRQFILTDTHTFSPTLLNEFRFGVTQIQISIFNCGVGGACGVSPTFSQDIGIPNANDGSEEASGGALIGNFGTGFLEFTGDGGLFQVKSKNPYFADSVTIIKGNQVIKAGVETRLRYLETIDGGRAGGLKGQFQFGDEGPATAPNPNCPAGSGTAAACFVDRNGIPFGGTGNGQANILLGLPARFVSRGKVFGGPFNLRSQEWGFFVQDDWKVSDHLTLNLGLRYDLFLPYTESDARLSLFDITQRRVVIAQNAGDRIIETDKNNFGPRLGFAYAFGPEKKLVLRGGYGLLYTLDGVDYPPGVRNPPFTNSVGFDQTGGANRTTTFSFRTGPPNVQQSDPVNLSPDIGVFAVDLEQKIASVQQFQLSLQYQFARDWSIDIGYVGNRSKNLLYANDISANGTAQARNLTNQFLNNAVIFANGASSQYDGLQMQVEKRLSANIQGQVSYTWSHTIDNSTGIFNGLGDSRNGRGGPINPFDLDLDRSNSSLDVRHLLSASAIIDLPFGKGQRFLNSGGVVDKVFSGFQVNIIQTARSGFPYSVSCGCGANRPSLIGDPFANLPAGRILNAAAFSAADNVTRSVTNAAGRTIRFGTLGRNTFTGPSIYNTDFSVFKNTAITETWKLQFGFEFFNLFNRANFTVPENNIQDGNFGRLRSAYPGRVVQYRLKLLF